MSPQRHTRVIINCAENEGIRILTCLIVVLHLLLDYYIYI